MNILVTGANGQLGSELAVLANNYENWNVFFYAYSEMDITNEAEITARLKENNADICINCAAYTAVDKAETDVNLCRKVNALGPELLAKACEASNTKLIHISSDYVYHTDSDLPLTEEDATLPKGIYAITKLEGDKAVIEFSRSYIIIRTSWVYSSFGNNFVKTMRRLGNDRDTLSIVADQIGTPTYARDIADTIFQICATGWTDDQNGVYNFSNSGQTNWADFARKIFELENIDCQVIDISTKDYGAAAERPLWSVLSKEKIKTRFGIKPRHWIDGLKECLELL
jgi:dTDP-4-dehydrorhamnose reductase